MLALVVVALVATACSTTATAPTSVPSVPGPTLAATNDVTPSASVEPTITPPATPSPATPSPTPAPTTPPEAVVQSFYDWWVDKGATGGDMDFSTRTELSPAFIKATRDAMHTPFAIEPFLCVQDGPVDRVLAETATVAGSTATVMITFDLGGQLTRQVELGLGPAGWQITAVRCDLI